MANIKNDKIDYNNILLEAVDTLMSTKLSKLPYDTTKIGVIINNQNAQYGQYTVAIDKTIQIVYSENKTYNIGDKVYIMTPNTNIADSTKIILSKYVDEDTLKSYSALDIHNINVYTIPYQSTTIQLIANNEDNSEITFPICELSDINLPINLFTNLAIRADFKCDLGLSYQMRSGVYGIKIILTTVDNYTYELQFDSSEFFGNPYLFLVPQTQTKTFDISNLSNITSIQVKAFQDNNFFYNSNLSSAPIAVPVSSFFNDNINLPSEIISSDKLLDLRTNLNQDKEQEQIYNIMISNLQFDLGFYIQSDTTSLQLYNNNTTVFPLWINKIDGEYKGYSNGVFQVQPIEVVNSSLHLWNNWRLMNSSENVYDYDEFEYQKQKQVFNICNNTAIRERAINELHLFDYKELLYPFACATEVDKQIKNLFPQVKAIAQAWTKLGNCLRLTFNPNYDDEVIEENIPTRDTPLRQKPKIGHARSNRGHEEAGDQDGHEVEITDWKRTQNNPNLPYRIFRAHDRNKQARLARLMAEACANDHIGYSRTYRAEAYSWLSHSSHLNNGHLRTRLDNNEENGITENVRVDCSSLVWLCCLLAGIENLPQYMFTTASESDALLATGEFDEISEYNEVAPNEPWYNLQAGDILVVRGATSGHTAIVTKSFSGNDFDGPGDTGDIDPPATPPQDMAPIEGYEIAESLSEEELEDLILADITSDFGLSTVLDSRNDKLLQNWLKIVYNLGINGYPEINKPNFHSSEQPGWNVQNEEWYEIINNIDFAAFIGNLANNIINNNENIDSGIGTSTELVQGDILPIYHAINNTLLEYRNYGSWLSAFRLSAYRFAAFYNKIRGYQQEETNHCLINIDTIYSTFKATCENIYKLLGQYEINWRTIQRNAVLCVYDTYSDTNYNDELILSIDYNLMQLQRDVSNGITFIQFLTELTNFEELYKDKYCMHWYQYEYNYIPENKIEQLYLPSNWKLIPSLTNAGINLNSTNLYSENQLVNIDEIRASSIRAILIFNHTPYYSNVINFNNGISNNSVVSENSNDDIQINIDNTF